MPSIKTPVSGAFIPKISAPIQMGGSFCINIGLFLDHEPELTFAEKIMKMEQS
jgi:hypothetical protein